jgi:hypothetical protein
MRGSDRPLRFSPLGVAFRRSLVVVMFVVSSVAMSSVAPTRAAAAPLRIDLRVLVLDDGSPWVSAIKSEMQVEGVPYTAAALGSPSRAVITDDYLSSGDRAFYQAVVGPDAALAALSDAERTALRAYETKFGVRQVDAYNWANPTVGLNYAAVSGDINGTIATVTAAGRADGFGYLNGPVPFSAGSWSYVAEPLAAASLPAGATYTTLVGAPVPNGATGSLIGVYSNAGVEQMIITAAFSLSMPQFKMLAHGIVTWATRGVHFGYDRNNLTFNVDDAFSSVAIWNSDANCTPGEDCSGLPEASVRMTPDDVAYALAWEQASGYQLTMAFNGAYADPVGDPLTQAFQANAAAFRWLNHGAEHLYQGCVQNFTVVPWQCTLDANGQVVWTSQQTIYNEITTNIATGQSLGLPFDVTEYLSGEHSGLFLLPQQPTDNPNFAAALAQAGILHIASDASRDNMARQVGSATTIPRHPTALYYNTATQAQAVDEYNWLYNTVANGGSGYCEANPATATCLRAPLGADGFTSYIVPTDAAFDMSFILSNDPRPFYAHTSNMTGDRLLYNLLDTILGTYRAAFTPATPLVNLTLTQASTQLDRQTEWTATGASSVTGYVQNGQITIANPAGVAVPFTAPVGSTVNGTTLESYGGELSAWLAPESTTGNLPGPIAPVVTVPQFTSAATASAAVSRAFSFTVTTTGSPAATITRSGTLPTGVTFRAGANGTATVSGTSSTSMAGRTFPVTFTATNSAGVATQTFTLTVGRVPSITSGTSALARTGRSFGYTVQTVATPTATITMTGTLPSGLTFVDNRNGTARISGTPARRTSRTYTIVFTAKNIYGTATRTLTLVVR